MGSLAGLSPVELEASKKAPTPTEQKGCEQQVISELMAPLWPYKQ